MIKKNSHEYETTRNFMLHLFLTGLLSLYSLFTLSIYKFPKNQNLYKSIIKDKNGNEND